LARFQIPFDQRLAVLQKLELADGSKSFATTAAFEKRHQTHPPIDHSFLGKVFHLDATGGANINAGAAPNTVLARPAKGYSGFAVRAPALESDRGLANQVPADVHTQSTEKALLSFRLLQVGVEDPEARREFADDRGTKTPRQQEFNDRAAVLADSFRVGRNL
jgi:DNA-binding transcriptional regulator LsrR (DeoR family)